MRNAVRALNTRLIVTLALSVATLFVGVPLAAAAGPTVLVAHRGVGTSTQIKYGFPEESLPAFDWAVKNGADIVDFDAQVTSDNQLVVMHDDTLNRTTNCTGDVRKRTLPYIKNVGWSCLSTATATATPTTRRIIRRRSVRRSTRCGIEWTRMVSRSRST